MKKLLFTPFFLLINYGCSTEDETQSSEPVVVQYTLSITSGEGGSVSDGGTYDEGTEATITATPSEGYEFSGWTGDFVGSENPVKINISGDKNITANFEQLFPIYLDENGITIKAYDFALVGNQYELNGVSYTVVDDSTIDAQIANANVNLCTTFVNNINESEYKIIGLTQRNSRRRWLYLDELIQECNRRWFYNNQSNNRRLERP